MQTPAKSNEIASFNWASLAPHFGLAAAGLYLLGFVVVSAHLNRFAAVNRRLLDAQYIPAGILFAVLAGLYLSFMKLFVFEAESVIEKVQKAGQPNGSPILWGIAAFLFQFLGMLFQLIFLTVFIASAFMEEPLGQVLGMMGIPLAINVTLFLQGTLDKRPRFRVFVFLATDVIGIAIFMLERKHVSESAMSLFWLLFFVTVALTGIIGVERKVKSKFGILHLAMPVVMLGATAMYFGAHMYGQVPMAFGGGKPFPVRLLVAPEAVPTIQRVLKLDSQLSVEVSLVTENQDEILVLAKQADGTQQPLRLSRRLFVGVIPQK